MKHFLILLSFIFLTLLSAQAQKHLGALKSKLLLADSVVIISHENTAQFYIEDPEDPGKGRYSPNPKLIVNGKANEKIIQERKVLQDTAVQRLSKILARPFQDKVVEMAKCFMPHHAILIFSKGKLSYVDICFECRRIETSEDIQLSEGDIDNLKWKELTAFYLQNNFKYELAFGE